MHKKVSTLMLPPHTNDYYYFGTLEKLEKTCVRTHAKYQERKCPSGRDIKMHIFENPFGNGQGRQ